MTRVRAAALLSALALLLLSACSSSQPTAGAAAAATFSGVSLAEPLPVPELSLTDQDGHPYDYAARTAGKAVLLFFGYTFCPDECPAAMAALAAALRSSPPDVRRRTQVVFVTSDPERDTPAREKQWMGTFDWPADSPPVALTGDLASIYAQAARVGVQLEPPVHEPDGSITVVHADQVLGYDSTGRSRVAWTEGFAPSAVAHDLPELVTPSPSRLPADGSAGQAGLGVYASDPRVSLPASPGASSAYIVLHNGSDMADALTSATSSEAGTVSLVSDAAAGGGPVTSVPLPAGGSVPLAPGGVHLVLGGLVAPLALGQQVHLQLHFAHAGPIAVNARVVSAADAAAGAHS